MIKKDDNLHRQEIKYSLEHVRRAGIEYIEIEIKQAKIKFLSKVADIFSEFEIVQFFRVDYPPIGAPVSEKSNPTFKECLKNPQGCGVVFCMMCYGGNKFND